GPNADISSVREVVRRYKFRDLVNLLTKASPLRSGDQTAGLSADIHPPYSMFSQAQRDSSQTAVILQLDSNIVQGPFESLANQFDLRRLYHQRRSEQQPVADHTEEEPAALGRLVHARTNVDVPIEGNPLVGVAHQFHTRDQAHPTHITHERMRLQPSQR